MTTSDKYPGRVVYPHTVREAALTVKRRATKGFSLLEILVVLAIGMVLVGVAIPVGVSAMRTYQLSAAVSAATGAIETTRYAAVMHGYPYQLAFTPATNSYQVSGLAPSGTVTGAPIPITGSGQISISRAATFQFAPGGTVTETSNNMAFSITSAWGGSNTITVSGVGNVTVTSP